MLTIERLQIFLKVFAIAPMTAIFAAMLPVDVMDRVHRLIGLGPLPEGPIVVYLARSTSLFYALHGVLLWYLASDLRRYAALFRFYLRVSLLFAVGIFLTDLTAGLPPRWTYAEGPFVAAFVVLVMWMFRVAESRSA